MTFDPATGEILEDEPVETVAEQRDREAREHGKAQIALIKEQLAAMPSMPWPPSPASRTKENDA